MKCWIKKYHLNRTDRMELTKKEKMGFQNEDYIGSNTREIKLHRYNFKSNITWEEIKYKKWKTKWRVWKIPLKIALNEREGRSKIQTTIGTTKENYERNQIKLKTVIQESFIEKKVVLKLYIEKGHHVLSYHLKITSRIYRVQEQKQSYTH